MKHWLRIVSLFIVVATTFVAGDIYHRVHAAPRFLPLPPTPKLESITVWTKETPEMQPDFAKVNNDLTKHPSYNRLYDQELREHRHDVLLTYLPPLLPPPKPQLNPAAITPRVFWPCTFTSYAIAVVLFVFSKRLAEGLPGLKSTWDLLVAHYYIKLSVFQLRLIAIATGVLPIAMVLIYAGVFGNEAGDRRATIVQVGIAISSYLVTLGFVLIPNRPKSLFKRNVARTGFEVMLPVDGPRKVITGK